MRSVGEGDFQTRVEVTRKDEFGLLSQRFNRMNDRIQMLVKENYEIKLKEKEAEIQALNMQMNPHFLYNTLNIMNWTAIENGQKELSKMLVCLSNMLHYTSRKDWGAVHLSEELEWMRNYFYIMAARFEGKFDGHLRDRARALRRKAAAPAVPAVRGECHPARLQRAGERRADRDPRLDVETAAGISRFATTGAASARQGIDAILYKESASIGIKNTISRIQMAYGRRTASISIPRRAKGRAS